MDRPGDKGLGSPVAGIRRLIDRGEYLEALDLGASLLDDPSIDPQGIRALQALCLSRLGDLDQAVGLLDTESGGEAGGDFEVHALLGSLFKRMALDRSGLPKARKKALLEKSLRSYMRGRELGGGYWCATNASTLALMLGRKALSSSLADEVIAGCWEEYCHSTTASPFWIPASLAEASLVKGDFQAAMRWYTAARSHAGDSLGSMKSIRGNASIILDALGADQEKSLRVMECIPRPKMVVFCGAWTTGPGSGQVKPGERARAALMKALAGLAADIGISSAIDMTDIIFMECLQSMGRMTIAVLPSPLDHSREKFAESCGASQAARFDSVIDGSVRVESSSSSRLESDPPAVSELCTDCLFALASELRDTYDAELTAVTAWEGRPGIGEGDPAYAISDLARLGLEQDRVTVRMLPAQTARPHRPGSETQRFDYARMGIFEPMLKPIVILRAAGSPGSEESAASRLDAIAGSLRSICDTEKIGVLYGGIGRGTISLILRSLDDLVRLVASRRRSMPGPEVASMVFHLGFVFRLETALPFSRGFSCAEVEEALDLAGSLSTPADLCTMQARAMLSLHTDLECGYSFRGRLETRSGSHLTLYGIS